MIVPEGVAEAWIEASRLMRDCNRVGSLAREVSCNHLRLHGKILPVAIGKPVDATRHQIVRYTENTYGELADSILALEADWRERRRPSRDFETGRAKASAMAAEFAAKLVCMVTTATFVKSHDVKELTSLAPPPWREVIENLKGETRRLVTPYEPTEVEPFSSSL